MAAGAIGRFAALRGFDGAAGDDELAVAVDAVAAVVGVFAVAAFGSQASGVICSGCDGQFSGVTIALFVALEAGMAVAADEGIAAAERDRCVAHALNAEGGFGGLATADIDVDIVQRHVEGLVCFAAAAIAYEVVDDADDVFGEVFRRGLQGRVRFGLGRVVVIGAGVHDLASRRRAVAGLGVVFLVAGGGRGVGIGAAAPRAGDVVRARGAALRAGAAARAGALRVRASRAGVLAGLVLFRGLRLVFLAAVVRRHVALGGAEVDLVFAFAVFCFEHCGGAAGGAALRAAAGGAGGIICALAALDGDLAVVPVAEAVLSISFSRVLDIDFVFVLFGDGDVTIAYVIDTRIRRCGHAGHHCGCQRQRRHPVRRGPGGVCRHPQRMPQNAHCKLAIRDHRNLL